MTRYTKIREEAAAFAFISQRLKRNFDHPNRLPDLE